MPIHQRGLRRGPRVVLGLTLASSRPNSRLRTLSPLPVQRLTEPSDLDVHYPVLLSRGRGERRFGENQAHDPSHAASLGPLIHGGSQLPATVVRSSARGCVTHLNSPSSWRPRGSGERASKARFQAPCRRPRTCLLTDSLSSLSAALGPGRTGLSKSVSPRSLVPECEGLCVLGQAPTGSVLLSVCC